jgi:fumarate hydratase class II
MATTASKTRSERDSMGAMEVPADAYYGASTQRAVLNFPISDLRFPRRFIEALGIIKMKAAEVNQELGLLEPRIAAAVIQAAQEVAEGKFDDQFVVDIFQTGSGTSTNMNANEVIANRAAEILGHPRGSRTVHPNDHVNKCQSSNDVIPSAIHLAALLAIHNELIPALAKLQRALTTKAHEFMPLIKTGRTHLQDATPIRLGQEFQGYAGQIERAVKHLRHAEDWLSELALGGTAVGTGLNAHPEFAKRVCTKLREWCKLHIRETDNHFQAQSTLDTVVMTSGILNTLAVALLKIANDIRWMGSGPRAGLFELLLPEVQPGSSIMPGKINPVIPESVIQVCAQVMGNHAAITVSGQWGFFELNTMMPVAAYNLLQSISLLAKASANFADQCVSGLQATDRGPALVEQGLMMATALAPLVGYDKAAEIAKVAYKTNRTVREVAKELTNLTDTQLDQALNPAKLVEPGIAGVSVGG